MGMNDDLISRKAAIESVDKIKTSNVNDKFMSVSDMILSMAQQQIEKVTSVPAVPLEPLCEWLAGYNEPPKYAMEIIPESGACLVNARAKAWEHHIRTMMACGLLEEIQYDTE